VTRDEALALVHEHVQNQNLRKHHYAVEAAMRALARYFKEDEEIWGIVGLVHDADYEETGDDFAKHTKLTAQWLEEKGASKEITNAVLSHNYAHAGNNPPANKMEWALFCCDELTGLIVATTLVRPERKIQFVTAKNVLKKFPEKAFAKGVKREQIGMCEEKLGIPLPQFVEIVLEGMKGIDKELGL